MVTNLRNELWSDIPGYNLYQVSNLGRVKAKAKDWVCGNGASRHKDEQLLTPRLSGHKKYLRVTLCVNGIPKCFNVHKLVALAFVPNIDNKPQIDHINRNIYDNRAVNLRWVTAKENCNNRGEIK